jgi:hypothetical protein
VLGLTGVLFATHPIHTDAVSSIVGRAEVLSGMFVLLSFLAYTGSVSKRDSINFSYGWIVVSLLFAFLALFCKEQGITVVAINAAYDFSCVCGLDVVTFVSMIFGTTPSSKPLKTKGSKVTQDDKSDGKNKPGRLPLHVQSFLKRLVVVGVGFGLIVFIRLKAGAKDMVPHRLTNRKPMFSIIVILIFNYVFFSIQPHQEVLPSADDQGLLLGISCMVDAVSKVPQLRLVRQQVRVMKLKLYLPCFPHRLLDLLIVLIW